MILQYWNKNSTYINSYVSILRMAEHPLYNQRVGTRSIEAP
jgi:hypothetical protein